MAAKDVLIVSQTNMKFQAPFAHMQKRQLSLLNLGNHPIIFSIDISNEALVQVFPRRGQLADFDTTELIIWMQPSRADQPNCGLTVNYKVKSHTAYQTEDEDWTHAQKVMVNISWQNCAENEKELLPMFGLDRNAKSLIRAIKKPYQPLCYSCSQKRLYQSARHRSWIRRVFLPLLLTIAVAYVGWEWL
ncbi:uncharacterized protein LOC6567170 isoform X1 [Drosophila grimshawi]|uniref:uncharacterized protein LOC6567170 isoform X1 n=1 Tax=Drosophila grimshawi TaxID=7222 RepID=UPI000C870B34|nr:uncharacterized protein LOC6567170 isoform X1 [Drosophila grimshawi]